MKAWADERPDDLAVVGPGLQLTSGELWDRALRIVGWLRSIGVPDSESLGTAMPPAYEPEFLIAMLLRGGPSAAWPGGAEVGLGAPLRRLVSPQAPVGVAADDWILFDDAARAQLASIDPTQVEIPSIQPDAVVRFHYSSGTTGTPKAIHLTAGQIEMLFGSPQTGGPLVGRSATLSLGTSGANQLAVLVAIAQRRPHLILALIEQGIPLLREFEIESLTGSPVQLAALVAAARAANEPLPALKRVVSSGAPLSAVLAESLAEFFSIDVFDQYGSSEVGAIALRRVAGPGADPRAVLSDDVEVELVDEAGAQVPDGEAGLMRVRSPTMSAGYLDGAVPTARGGFRDGWFYTGDLARRVDGQLEILGRDDDLLNIGGQKILVRDVEDAFMRLEDVDEAIATRVTDAWEIPQLAVAFTGSAEPRALVTSELRAALGGITPGILVRLPELPRTATGKPKRVDIAALLQERMSAQSAPGSARDDALLEVDGRLVRAAELEAYVGSWPGVRSAAACTIYDALGAPVIAIAFDGDALDDPAARASEVGAHFDIRPPALIARVPSIRRSAAGIPDREALATHLQSRIGASSFVP